jgi:hypothetical protein
LHLIIANTFSSMRFLRRLRRLAMTDVTSSTYLK